jgi:hypothetical protein
MAAESASSTSLKRWVRRATAELAGGARPGERLAAPVEFGPL